MAAFMAQRDKEMTGDPPLCGLWGNLVEKKASVEEYFDLSSWKTLNVLFLKHEGKLWG